MGGGPPARRPRCELRSARRLEARPGPAAAHGHRSLAPQAPPAPSTPVGRGVLACGLVRWLVVWPGPPVPPAPPAPSTPAALCRWRVAGCVGPKPGQALPSPMGTAARPSGPSGPSGALRTSGTWCAGVWLGALACCLARPCRSLWALRGSRVLSFWGALVCVVTNVVNPRCFSCGFLPRCYKRRQSEGFFAENGGFWA